MHSRQNSNNVLEQDDDIDDEEIVRRSKLQSMRVLQQHLDGFLKGFFGRQRHDEVGHSDGHTTTEHNVVVESRQDVGDARDSTEMRDTQLGDDEQDSRPIGESCAHQNHDDEEARGPSNDNSYIPHHPTFEDWIEQLFPDNVVRTGKVATIDERLYYEGSVVVVLWNERVPHHRQITPRD